MQKTQRRITPALLRHYTEHLREQERSVATVEKYTRALRTFYLWLPDEKSVDRENVMAYKQTLSKGHSPGGVNVELAALNGFFRFMGWNDLCLRPLRIQRRAFADRSRELTRAEYERLVKAAERRKDCRLSLLLQTMAATGIRVSEVQFITVEAVQTGKAEISLKGKIRTILLPGKLCRKLRKYLSRAGITSGAVFRTRTGRALGRKEIWAQMKTLCAAAGVEPGKVFPHNLRHLFARVFYAAQKDIAKLADLLGHSSIETTRIYLLSSGTEHQRALDSLRLVC